MPSLTQATQSYHLHLVGTSSSFSVLRFKGKEALSTPYRFKIDATSPISDLATASALSKTASFTLIARGGASFTIENGGFVFTCPGEFRIKADSFVFEGPSNVSTPSPLFPNSELAAARSYPWTR